jgi:hypothetical protein
MIARHGLSVGVVLALLAGMLPVLALGLRVDGFDAPALDGVAFLPSSEAADGLVAVRFGGGRDWPALRFAASKPLDWSAASALAMPVANPGDTPFTLLLRLDDDPRADGGDRSLTGIVTLAPHAHGMVILPLTAGPGGMRGRPGVVGTTQPGDIAVTDLRGSVDAHHIVALHVSGLRTPDERVLRLGPPQWRTGSTVSSPNGPIADRFGQAIAGDWPEKVRDDADLRRKLAAAAAQTGRLAGDTASPGDRPAGRATGFFRVEKAQGHWRLVAPDGRPFFSLGVDAVTPSNPTIVTGRRTLFQDLPAAGSALGASLRDEGGRTLFDVGEADLRRAYGPDWRPRWDRDVVRRLKAWGFNTLGNWSDPALAASGLASVTFYDVEGASTMLPMDGGRALPDPFDPRFATVADGVAATMTAATRAQPALLGYFSGNEMPWGSADRRETGIAAHVLAGPASEAKRAFLADLRARHGTVAAWASAWGVGTPASWDALLAVPEPMPAALTPAAATDIVAFQRRFADLYFETVAKAIRRHDPDHLYLGTRFAAAPPEVIAACARWCDVLSFNVYGASPALAAARWRAYDRPVLIGEFHFGSTDRGSYWPGMVDAGSEERRGPAYAAYLDAARRDPAIVGCHWYQYADEPLTGRPYDGENGHIGLVAVTGVPYAGFVAAVAAANRRALRPFDHSSSDATRTVP